jgi:hypothetical protein
LPISSLTEASAYLSQRADTVAALHAKLRQHHLILVCYDIEHSEILAYSMKVRGTPGSGKTALTRLLAAHIRRQDSSVKKVLRIYSWAPTAGRGGYDAVLKSHGWSEKEKTVFIFDEGQMTYDDEGLWNDFLKSIHESKGLRQAIVFASYGSPTSRILIKGNIPMDLPEHQRVTLRHVAHGDGLGPAGLLFTRSEFNDLVNSYYRSPDEDFYFDQSFFDAIFEITNGHVGAITDFIEIIVADDVSPFLLKG